MVAERTGPHAPVKLSGSIPPLAEAFHQRPETGLDLRVGLYPGDTVVLTHGEETAVAPARQGGTGKTQIAVAFSHALWGAGRSTRWSGSGAAGRRSSPARAGGQDGRRGLGGGSAMPSATTSRHWPTASAISALITR